MATATIFKFCYFDPDSGTYPVSRFWGTFDGISTTKIGIVMRETGVEVDEAILNENGLTPRDYDPHSPVRSSDFPSRAG
jgi:hypothetical protein